MTRGRAEIAGRAGDERGNKYNLIADLALMIKIRLWSIGQILLFLKPMDDAFLPRASSLFPRIIFCSLFSFTASLQISISSKLELKGIHQRKCVYKNASHGGYITFYVYNTLRQGPTLPLCSYVHTIFHIPHINLRHTALETCSYFFLSLKWIFSSLLIILKSNSH